MPSTAGLTSELASWSTTLFTNLALDLKTSQLVRGYSWASMALHATSNIHLHFAGCSQLTCIYSRWIKIDMHRLVCLCVFWRHLLYWYYSRWFSSTKLQASTQNPTHSLTTTRTVQGIHGFYSSWLHTLALGGKYFPFSCEVKGARGNSAKGFLCRGPGEGQHDWVSHSINIVTGLGRVLPL